MAEWLDIQDGKLFYDASFYTPEEADSLFKWLDTQISWRQETSRGFPVPRLNAWFAEAGLRYAYSGIAHEGSGWLAELETVKQHVEAASGATFNSLLLNMYRDGKDSIGFHTDAEPELGTNPVVATLSLGSERDFVLKHTKTKEKLVVRMPHGSLLILGGISQHHWLHGIPKTTKEVGKRISLTFRQIRPEDERGS